jgi:hypothetical protein
MPGPAGGPRLGGGRAARERQTHRAGRLDHGFLRRWLDRHQRQPELVRHEPHLREQVLDRPRVRLDERGAEERHQLLVREQRLVHAPRAGQVHERAHLPRRCLPDHRDDALAAHRAAGQRQRVVARAA